MTRRHAAFAVALLLALTTPAIAAQQAEAQDVSPDEVQKRIEDGTAPLILDVRRPDEFAEGHLPGAVNIPHDQLAERLEELGIALDEEVIVYCRSGRRAGVAESVLGEAGFTNVWDMDGHWLGWVEAGRPTVIEEESN